MEDLFSAIQGWQLSSAQPKSKLNRTDLCRHASPRHIMRAGTLEAGIQEEGPDGRFILLNVTAGESVIIPQGMPS